MLISLPLCTGLLSDQSDSAEAGLIEREHGLPDFTELELCIAPDHDLGVLLVTNSGAEGFVEMLACDPLVIDPQLACVVDGDQYPASLISLVARFCSVG